MKIEQFLSKLKDVAPKYSWAITPKGIRGTLREVEDEYDYCFCPITAVYHSEMDCILPDYLASSIGTTHFHLSDVDIATLICSADLVLKYPDSEEKFLNEKMSGFSSLEVNEELMKAVGLAA